MVLLGAYYEMSGIFPADHVEAPMNRPDNHLDLVVVVSGVPRPGRINTHQSLEQLVRKVLRDSGDEGRDPADYELRTEDGRLLELSGKAAALGLVDGQILFLNPRAGAGG